MPAISNCHSLKMESPSRGTVKNVICSFTLVLADVFSWVIAYKTVSPDEEMAGTKFAIMAAAWCVWAALVRKQYNRRYSFWTELGFILQGVFMLAFVGSVLKALIGNANSLLAWLIGCMLLAFFLPMLRWVGRAVLRYFGVWSWPTVVFGCSENAIQAVLALRSEAAMGYVVAALVLPRGVAAPNSALLALGYPLLSWPESAEEFDALRGYHCVIAVEAREFELRDNLIRQLSQHQINHVHVIPAMRGVPLFGLHITQFFSHELLMIHVRNNLMNPIHRWTKRVFDVVGASCLIMLLSPLMLWVAYKIFRSDGAPVIFSQPRVGQGLKTFKFYKFRSMIKNAEDMLKEWEATNSSEWQEYTANNFKLANDPRLISIGALIRRTSIDELPQLFNVIMGDMSLVGPRPLLPREINDYGEELSLYGQTPPGLTGLWQISGRSQTTFEDRVAFDAWYVKNWSIWTDITILFKTWSVVFKRKGAY